VLKVDVQTFPHFPENNCASKYFTSNSKDAKTNNEFLGNLDSFGKSASDTLSDVSKLSLKNNHRPLSTNYGSAKTCLYNTSKGLRHQPKLLSSSNNRFSDPLQREVIEEIIPFNPIYSQSKVQYLSYHAVKKDSKIVPAADPSSQPRVQRTSDQATRVKSRSW
jgi:hypothetical protein